MSRETESCGKCRFYSAPSEPVGLCLAHPPTIMAATFMKCRLHDSGEIVYHADEFHSSQPETGRDDWCGEFQRRQET